MVKIKKIIIKKVQDLFDRLGIYIASSNLNPDFGKRVVYELKKKEFDCVFDVGANDGGFARDLIKKGYQGKIISFEPTSSAYKKLKKYASNNSQWFVEKRCAIGESEKMVVINIAKNSVSSSIVPLKKNESKIWPGLKTVDKETVKMHKLDYFLIKNKGSFKKALLKLDTQGYEMNILSSCKNLDFFEGIIIEIQIKKYYQTKHDFNDLLNFLSKKGFILKDLEPGFRDKDGSVIEFDALFLKKN